MKRFRRKKQNFLVEEDATVIQGEFKPFRETYTVLTFTMVAGMLYPTPETELCRAVCIGLYSLSLTPLTLMALLDIWRSWQEGDIVNIIRHGTVMGPLLAVPFKMLLLYWRRTEAYTIINKIDKDYTRFNSLPDHHKAIARRAISQSVYYSEKLWAAIVTTTVTTFPLTAAVLNIYNYIFKSEPIKHMVHDIRKPFSEPEARFESPFFEIMFLYLMYCGILLILSFVGFDAFFGVIINHLCLKMDLLCRALEDAMWERDVRVVLQKTAEVIEEHNEVFRMVKDLQKTFNVWLGMIVIATMVQICNCMYQVLEGYGIDPRYLIFFVGTVVHIYVPCRYAAKLQATALGVSTRAYCCGWERVPERRVRTSLLLVIARAQAPLIITAFNSLHFGMELFVAILKSSYSMFTLLRS